jgi:hypothetical protein
MRAEGKLTARAYELLHFLAESGADRPEGTATSVAYLRDALGGGNATVRRTLERLRDLGLIDYADHAGRAIFTVRTTPALAALADEPRSQPRSKPPGDLSDPVSEVDGNASQRERGSEARKPASVKAAEAIDASDVSEVARGPETETETETEVGRSVGGLATPGESPDGPADPPALSELMERARPRSIDDGIAGR